MASSCNCQAVTSSGRLWLTYGNYYYTAIFSQMQSWKHLSTLNTLRPRQNGRHFRDDTFKWIFLNETVRISTKISLKFVPRGPIHNIPSLVDIMAWRRSSDEPLSEPMMVSLLRHLYATRPQWVNYISVIPRYTGQIIRETDIVGHNLAPDPCGFRRILHENRDWR